ncbi:MAG: N-acetylmuramoyl-L-alanine amidase [Proteobacteria bacterium]|nr:N-acetylmuramoyl-L-alanine amidase [Pseudomonadota bacterium]MBU4286845.1 N-acetylmuramoyl-L-alanine amidase [Pseudomonadota bacterium]MCG2757514.1 N-acetylmuramoyl-L-alanine amidase [Desulfobacteraceae bacterium]
MSAYCNIFSIYRYIAILLFFAMLVMANTAEVMAKETSYNNKKIIVLDPGHGGHDKGAQGTNGTYEKTLSLKLAHIIAKELEDKYRVFLTRTDDYRLDNPGRIDAANHLEADLFISIHSGGSFLHKANGIYIYYYNEISWPANILESTTLKTIKSKNIQPQWHNIQDRHKATSHVLAESVKNRINEHIEFAKCKVQGAPVLVLSGADMPAILIETGYISNPAEEKELKDAKVLSNFAKGISKGIEDFFSNL